MICMWSLRYVVCELVALLYHVLVWPAWGNKYTFLKIKKLYSVVVKYRNGKPAEKASLQGHFSAGKLLGVRNDFSSPEHRPGFVKKTKFDYTEAGPQREIK